MIDLHPSIANLPLPARIARLPIDSRGFPIPWFVANGDHRVVDARRFAPAIKEKRCWICGERLGRMLAFIIGPMCAITRTISEPPSHRECCEYTVQACPWLSRPHAHRRVSGLPDGVKDPAGLGIKRNPGVACVWVTREFKVIRAAGGAGILFKIGDPAEASWWSEGRHATPIEVHQSVYSGLPFLYESAVAEDQARSDGKRIAEFALATRVAATASLWPT